MHISKTSGACLALLLLFGAAAQAQDATDPRYTWDLTELYESPEAWQAARQQVLDDIDSLDELRGTLGDSADALYTALDRISAVTRGSVPRIDVFQPECGRGSARNRAPGAPRTEPHHGVARRGGDGLGTA